MNVPVQVATKREEHGLFIGHVDRTTLSPGLRQLDFPGLKSETVRHGADILDFRPAGILDVVVPAVPSLTRQSVFRTDDPVVERVMRVLLRIRAVPRTELLEDAFV